MFKYYSIPELFTLEKVIGDERSLKFSSAFNLNDPFELKFNLIIDPNAKGQLEEYLIANPEQTPEDFKVWQNLVIENKGYVWNAEQQLRATLSQMITICSFSEKNDNNLMWSHYTDNHRGICVEYNDELIDFLQTLETFLAYDKIEYSIIPPEVDSLEEMISKIKKMIFNKQLEWNYEQEHRVILLSNKNTDLIPIGSKLIKAVYIGAKLSADITSKIVEICKENNFDCYYGITIGNSYKVNFEKQQEGNFFMRSFWK